MQNSKSLNTNKLNAKVWSGIVIFGLFGQIAWMVENMYLNVFMDRTVTTNPFAVQLMVALSAIVATAATLIGGTFSDRIGKRKRLMSVGYIIWGVSVMAFAVISPENTKAIFTSASNSTAINLTVAFIVIMDCIMSFIGSFANDAAFNAWVTDVTNPANRGKAEGVLATMPIVAMAVIFGAMDWMTADTYKDTSGNLSSIYTQGAEKVSSGNWLLFFIILGGLTTLIGILGLFLVKDSYALKPNKAISYKDMFYGFKPKVIKENKNLYLVYISMAIVGIANMSYMPYIIIYIQRTLGYDNYIFLLGAIILISAALSVVFGMIIDKFDRKKFMLPVLGLYILGALCMFLFSPILFKQKTPMILVGLSGLMLIAANLSFGALFQSMGRDLTPKDKIGLFQGVRMFFFVLVPMVVGPLITAIITVNTETLGKDYYGAPIYQYPPYMFLVAAGAILFLLIPIYFLIKKEKAVEKTN